MTQHRSLCMQCFPESFEILHQRTVQLYSSIFTKQHILTRLCAEDFRALVISNRKSGVSRLWLTFPGNAQESESRIGSEGFIESFNIGSGFGLVATPYANNHSMTSILVERM